jgi:hypothetical protein
MAKGASTKGIYIEQLMWHIFSYERAPCLHFDKALQASIEQ